MIYSFPKAFLFIEMNNSQPCCIVDQSPNEFIVMSDETCEP
ncbi:hypothetical protein VDG1235_763 [Verrucomicrobiia bacterium DG1235]|nr:hypothetical protein VDG1235_763 [Verrucomicrobiae bacterium DG1235]